MIANAGIDGITGGAIVFKGGSGGNSRIILHDWGTLDVSQLAAGPVTIGSLEGDGVVLLGYSQPLTVGVNSRSATFSGTIKNGVNGSGSLVKIGHGTLTLSGSNTYQNGTVVEDGGLIIDTLTGSGTGTGSVQVNGGLLGGTGTITGDVTIAEGSGPGAVLMPGAATDRPATLHVLGSVTFKINGNYASKLHPIRAKADSLVTNGGVTIEPGAVFSFVGNRIAPIPVGTVFTLVRNNAASSISGNFINLIDGSTVTAGNNKLQVSYSGGDGNDLTLTVVP